MHGTLYRVEVKLQTPLQPTVEDERLGRRSSRTDAPTETPWQLSERFQQAQRVVLFWEWTFHRQESWDSPTHNCSPAPATDAGERARAARIPWRIRVGLGGQPGTATSTGNDVRDAPATGVALAKDATRAAAVAEGDHELRIGCGLIGPASTPPPCVSTPGP